MDKFYVYMYLREDKTPYYVGKGSGKRAWCKAHTVAVPKDTQRILILYDNLNEESSFKLEKYFISYYGRKDNGTGILRNLTDGGDGASGHIKSIETKAKIGKAHKNKIVSKETRQLQSKKKQGLYDGENNPMWGIKGDIHPLFGKKRTEESVLKNSKKFIAIDKYDNEYVEINLRRFCREHNLIPNNMSEVANGKRKQHKGWTCKYIEESNG